MGKRRTMLEIFGRLIEAVPQRGSPQPLSVIADRAKVSYETAERYMEIIMMVQDAEKIDISEIGEQRGYSQRESRRKLKP